MMTLQGHCQNTARVGAKFIQDTSFVRKHRKTHNRKWVKNGPKDRHRNCNQAVAARSQRGAAMHIVVLHLFFGIGCQASWMKPTFSNRATLFCPCPLSVPLHARAVSKTDQHVQAPECRVWGLDPHKHCCHRFNCVSRWNVHCSDDLPMLRMLAVVQPRCVLAWDVGDSRFQWQPFRGLVRTCLALQLRRPTCSSA